MHKQSSYSFFSEPSKAEQRRRLLVFGAKSEVISDNKTLKFQVKEVAYSWRTYPVTKTERLVIIHKQTIELFIFSEPSKAEQRRRLLVFGTKSKVT